VKDVDLARMTKYVRVYEQWETEDALYDVGCWSMSTACEKMNEIVSARPGAADRTSNDGHDASKERMSTVGRREKARQHTVLSVPKAGWEFKRE